MFSSPKARPLDRKTSSSLIRPPSSLSMYSNTNLTTSSSSQSSTPSPLIASTSQNSATVAPENSNLQKQLDDLENFTQQV